MRDGVIDDVIETAYDCAVAPSRWPDLLLALRRAFDCPFADIFARTEDRSRFHGLASGLDRADYEDEFLGTWVKRNVWGTRRPVQVSGEIVTTREMMDPSDLRRTEMYNDYLAPRGLHEGLRLALHVGDGWIQDISLLRPWSIGPYSAAELAIAAHVLPHLQRSAAIARRLREAGDLARAGAAALDALRQPLFLLDDDGRVIYANRFAEALAAEGDALRTDHLGLLPARASQSGAVRSMLARATGAAGPARAGAMRLARESGRVPVTLMAMPIAGETDWAAMRRPAAVVLVSDPQADAAPMAEHLGQLFGLTHAEAELAVALLSGQTLAAIAAQRGRSVFTVRTQLARLMAKTETNRQSDLMRLLMSVPTPDRPAPF